MKIALIDYGAGNLHSAEKALRLAAAGVGLPLDIAMTSDPKALADADRVVLPGDGAFRECRQAFSAIDGLEAALHHKVIEQGAPFLGICVGMQLMASRGHEGEITDGFGWIAGEVRKIPRTHQDLKIPHMGWNELTFTRDHPVTKPWGQSPPPHAYFLHSYQMIPADPKHIIASTDHGGPVAAIVGRDNLFGVQFHPEKSQAFGLALLREFLVWSGR